MSIKIVSWVVLAAIMLGAVLLFNYWASYQLLSTLAYTGIVAALFGLANLAFPFRYLGIRRRTVGVLVVAAGVALAVAALYWPVSVIRVAEPRTRLDELMPEYQFYERHSTRIHAGPEHVIEAIRQSTFGDMRSLRVLLKVRAAALRAPSRDNGAFGSDKRIFDAFTASGYVSGATEHEVLMCGGANVREGRVLPAHSLQEFADYRVEGGVKIGFDFYVEDAGEGWSKVTAETRVLAVDEATTRGLARYWRLIVPGSGLLRREWLEGIKRRAESKTLNGVS